jgi:DNA-binding CsgD family transcriptional regulator
VFDIPNLSRAPARKCRLCPTLLTSTNVEDLCFSCQRKGRPEKRQVIRERFMENRKPSEVLASSCRKCGRPSHPGKCEGFKVAEVVEEKKDFALAKVFWDPLSPREQELLDCFLIDGAGNAELAARFGISEESVKRHFSTLFCKTGCHSRSELAVRMLRRQMDAKG